MAPLFGCAPQLVAPRLCHRAMIGDWCSIALSPLVIFSPPSSHEIEREGHGKAASVWAILYYGSKEASSFAAWHFETVLHDDGGVVLISSVALAR